MNRYIGLLLAATGVAAGFIIAIGTGFRVTDPSHSPISDGVHFASIGVLAAIVIFGMFRVWQNRGPSKGTVHSWTLRDLERTTEQLKPDDEARTPKYRGASPRGEHEDG